VYGFPNPKAVRVSARVGYATLDDIVRCSRVLRHAPYLQRMLPRPLARACGAVLDVADRCIDALRELVHGRLASEWREETDPRMQDLWETAAPAEGLTGSKSVRGLDWRFSSSSVQRARYLLVSKHSGGPLEAWFACEPLGTVLQVRDFWSVGANRTMPRAAILALIRAARSAGYSVVFVECTASSRALASWRRAGFSERGRRPVVGAWSPRFGAVAGSALAIHLTAADEDE